MDRVFVRVNHTSGHYLSVSIYLKKLMNCRIKTVRADPNGWVTDKSARNGRQARRSGERERERWELVRKKREVYFMVVL